MSRRSFRNQSPFGEHLSSTTTTKKNKKFKFLIFKFLNLNKFKNYDKIIAIHDEFFFTQNSELF